MEGAPPASSKVHPYDEMLRLSRDWGQKSSFIYLFTRPVFLEQFADLLPHTFLHFGIIPTLVGLRVQLGRQISRTSSDKYKAATVCSPSPLVSSIPFLERAAGLCG